MSRVVNTKFSAFSTRLDHAIMRLKKENIRQILVSYSKHFSRKQKTLIMSLLWVFLIMFVLSPAPKDIRPVNVHARSISVAWILPRPTFGCVVLIPQSFNSLPKLSCDRSFASVHLQELSNLRSQTTYKIMLLSGLRPVLWGNPTVTTTPIQEDMPAMPKPGYGSVVFNNEKVEGALVLVYANTPAPQYAVAALTNVQGNYAVDLANISRDESNYILTSFLSANRSAKLEADVRLSTPFPPLLLHDQLVFWWENVWFKLKGGL